MLPHVVRPRLCWGCHVTGILTTTAKKYRTGESKIMWRILNSPIVITILIVIALFSYDQLKKNKAASEIRAVYEELISISEDAKDDLERKKLIEGFVKEAGKQIRDGFGFFDNEEDKRIQAEENKLFFETKKNG